MRCRTKKRGTKAIWKHVPDPDAGRAPITVVPNATVDSFWLPLHAFDYSSDGKNGCGVVVESGLLHKVF